MFERWLSLFKIHPKRGDEMTDAEFDRIAEWIDCTDECYWLEEDL